MPQGDVQLPLLLPLKAAVGAVDDAPADLPFMEECMVGMVADDFQQ